MYQAAVDERQAVIAELAGLRDISAGQHANRCLCVGRPSDALVPLI
jgi:hypothetical protein